MLNLCVLLCAFSCLTASGAFANILLIGNNISLSFKSVPANFGRPVTGSGEHGTIFLASPVDACSPLTNTLTKDSINSGYLLIIKGGCEFVDKIRRAQAAGFKAAIVYNDEDSNLFPMMRDPGGIHIHVVFVSQSTGLKLQEYVGVKEIKVLFVESYENSAWSIMAVSFISLLAMSAVVASCCFVRRHRIRRNRPRGRVREYHGMSSQLVKAMPSLEFTEDLEDNCTSATCAICLDDYNVGDKIRILPCSHKFHMICVDAWLTSWRTFCPVCKRDANTATPDPPATERTPLLSSPPASVASTSMSSSARSSRPMQIGRSPTSLSYTPRQSFPSYHESRYPSSAQSSLDMRNASSSYRSSRGSHFNSNSFASPSLSPLNSIYMAFYSNSGNGSSSYIRSSSQQAQSLLQRESAVQSPLQC
ncbi:receptor homology region, transmembrane domain- and RING domain-containing protein 2 [Lactuca sativa]|uniref:RING-type domain-containing protein n=1 Tax=Lactuca sativa TaxID=4236 RepID=A0A9R1XYC3_LACSA|nr:receptor homology region, transmembrane domain- and RING domain-containing protein 2 [Lactuca sativa]KAJ0227747.1 hypothetical protein LSAT_V11C100004870 [Lactuca sativa]